MSLEPKRNLTDAGNPAKPTGKAGEDMLHYMNEEHADLTAWGVSLWEYNPTDHILDIGCGGGATLNRLVSLVPGGHFTGVDYSDVSVKLSKEFNAEHIKSGKMEILCGSVSDLPFDDNTFDKAITVESFYFWPDPVHSLSEVLRVIKPGGSFMLVSEIYERPDLTPHCRDNISRYSMNVPDIEEFNQLFKDAGFAGTDIHTKDSEFWIVVIGTKL